MSRVPEVKSDAHPLFAAVLSALCPGLGQLYNGQWVKGAAVLFATVVVAGGLLSALDLPQLEATVAGGGTPSNVGQLFILGLMLLTIALWSIIDARRVAERTQSRGEPANDAPSNKVN